MLINLILIVSLTAISPNDSSFCKSCIEWQFEKKLEYTDFQGKIKKDTTVVAITSITINYKITQAGDSLNFIFYALFDKDSSWMALKDPVVLKHEQLHFDIAELCMRYFYKRCRDFDFSKTRFVDQIHEVFHDAYKSFAKFEDQYDIETKNGTISARQQKWERYIADELKNNLIRKDKKLLKVFQSE